MVPIDPIGVGQVNDRRQMDSRVCETASEVSAARLAEKTVGDYWAEVLESNADENKRVANKVMDSFHHVRPLFLRVFRMVFKIWSGLHVVGLENLPPKMPYILAANHECHLDNLFVACSLPREVQRKMVVLSKKEHFAHLVTRLIAKLCHGIPVDRGQISAGVLGICSQVLRQEGVLLIHPEGTRSPDGHLQPFRKGVAVLASHIQCPVVPIHIDGAHEFWPKHSFFPRRRSRISVTIGPPIHPRTMTAETPKEFTTELMLSIAALSDEPTKRIGSAEEGS
jgi:1-acyl-sn-glycerol-3-phosphate acyltransferase